MFWLAGLARCLLLSTVLMRCGIRRGQRALRRKTILLSSPYVDRNVDRRAGVRLPRLRGLPISLNG